MNQNLLLKQLQDIILERLPAEAVKELSEIPDDENRDSKIQELLSKNNIDVNELIKEITKEENSNA